MEKFQYGDETWIVTGSTFKKGNGGPETDTRIVFAHRENQRTERRFHLTDDGTATPVVETSRSRSHRVAFCTRQLSKLLELSMVLRVHHKQPDKALRIKRVWKRLLNKFQNFLDFNEGR